MREVEERVAKAIHAKHAAPDDNQHWFHEKADRCELSRQLARAAIAAMPGWQSVETYPGDDSVVLVANPAEGTLPVIAWRIEDAWFAYDLSKRDPLNPQPTIWMAWPKMPRTPAILPHDGSITPTVKDSLIVDRPTSPEFPDNCPHNTTQEKT